jgi:hypothetical protein
VIGRQAEGVQYEDAEGNRRLFVLS